MNPINSKLNEDNLRELLDLRYRLNALLDSVCQITYLSKEELTGRSRKPEIADVRSSFMAIARESYPYASFSLIGEIVNRDHSTVIAAIRRTKEIKETRMIKQSIKFELEH